MRRSGAQVQSPGGFAPEGVPFSEASSRAKRGSAERSEAVPPSEARLHREARPRGEGHREVAITKKLKKVPPESPGEPLICMCHVAVADRINGQREGTITFRPGCRLL